MTQNQVRWRAGFHDSFIAQAVVSVQDEILDVNDQFCQLFASTRNDLVGLLYRSLFHPDEPLEVNLPEEFAEGHLQNWQTEQRYMRHNGLSFWGLVSVSVVRQEGVMVELIVQVQDISEKKQLEDDLKQGREDIEQFAYIASHDLREPLMTIAGFASLLQKRYGETLDERGKHVLEQILDGTRHMEKKIDDLLAFSRAGRTTPEGSFPLGLAIDEAKRSVVRAIEETGAMIIAQDDLPVIHGDRSMVAQIFQNLFSNSIKYRGAEPPVIQVSAEPYGDNYWLVTVKDNGIGFDPRHKDRIFGVFQRLYTVEQYPGTGIGLAIAKKIVERHRGHIWADSVPGIGASFHFTLPVIPRP